MILKALYDYYHRLGTLPAFGTELKEIHYVVVIDKAGDFKRFESKKIDKRKSASFCVAKGVTRTRASKSNILWDNGKYVFGFDAKDKEYNELFVATLRDIAARHADDISMQALLRFYSLSKEEMIVKFEEDSLWDEVRANLQKNFSFQLEGEDRLIAEKAELFLDMEDLEEKRRSVESICLITGEKGPVVRLTTPTPMLDSQPVASIVKIQINSGYDSYGKTQAYNAPISREAEFAYSTALKNMLGKDSRNKFTIGKRVFLFWGTKKDKALLETESIFCDFLNIDFQKDNPDENVRKVEKFFKSIWSGEIKTDLDDVFYILGLAPNIGRIAIVSFDAIPLKKFAVKILQHFSDMDIIDSREESERRPFSGLYSMLSAVTLKGKVSGAAPHLPEEVMYAIINGTPYPYPLYTAAIRRICAECEVTIGRAAIIKAYINRKFNEQSIKLEVMLDKTNDNGGYLCGRLVAVLEKIQTDAKSGDSIKTRYMTAASSTPSAVFPSMFNLSMHHMDKLSDGTRIFYEQLKQEILEKMPADGFPSHLDLNDQGRFFVGYYHQRTDLYTSKKN